MFLSMSIIQLANVVVYSTLCYCLLYVTGLIHSLLIICGNFFYCYTGCFIIVLSSFFNMESRSSVCVLFIVSFQRQLIISFAFL